MSYYNWRTYFNKKKFENFEKYKIYKSFIVVPKSSDLTKSKLKDPKKIWRAELVYVAKCWDDF